MTSLMTRAQGAALGLNSDRLIGLRGRLAIATFAVSALLAAGLAQAQAGERPESFADLAERVSPAVVGVEIERAARPGRAEGHPFQPGSPYHEFFERYFGGPPAPHPGSWQPQGWQQNSDRSGSARRGKGLGSGFIVDQEGYVVTNNHVIAGAETILVTLDDGRKLEATLVGRDPRTDLALLKVESAAPLPTVAFGDSDEVRVGDWVMAVGNPFGFGGTVTVGVVSAQGREMGGRNGGGLVDFLQIDAPINRGNSGGPTFNLEGEVIGINTAIFSPNGGNVGIGFAIPADQAEAVIADLRDDGKVARGWLGVRIQPVTEEIAEGFGLVEPAGALIAEVTPGSPAEAGGLAPGDIILSWDGAAVKRLRDLPRLVTATPAGETVALTLWRRGEAVTLEVKTGLLDQAAATPEHPQEARQETLGLRLVQPNDGEPGLLVADLDPEGPAAKAGLRQGDRLVTANLKPLQRPSDLDDSLAAARDEGRDRLPLLVRRQGQESFVTLPVPLG